MTTIYRKTKWICCGNNSEQLPQLLQGRKKRRTTTINPNQTSGQEHQNTLNATDKRRENNSMTGNINTPQKNKQKKLKTIKTHKNHETQETQETQEDMKNQVDLLVVIDLLCAPALHKKSTRSSKQIGAITSTYPSHRKLKQFFFLF